MASASTAMSSGRSRKGGIASSMTYTFSTINMFRSYIDWFTFLPFLPVGWFWKWGWPLALALVFIAIGPAVVAYRCWGLGVQRAGPALAGFFSNLTPLFAAVLSAAFLGEPPRLFHAVAFALIVAGIVVSSRR